MIRVYRERYTCEPPPHAERKGPKVRWKGRGGKLIEGTLLDSGKVRVEVRDVWHFSYTGPDGGIVRGCRGFGDKAATEAEARRRQTLADRQRTGIAPRVAEKHAAKTLADHLADYLEYLRSKGRGKNHVNDVGNRVGYLLRAVDAKTAADVTEGAVSVALMGLRGVSKVDGRKRAGIGPTTANGYLGSAKAFLTWCRKEGRIASNPLADVVRETDRTDVRRARRRITDDELSLLIAAAEKSRKRNNRDIRPIGEARAVLYLTAAFTGYRAAELAALTPESFRLDHSTPHAVLPAKSTKGKREGLVPISPAIVDRLRTFLATRPPGKPVWPTRWYRKAAQMLRLDLAACDPPIPYRDHRGRYADFHSLRRTFVRKLRDAGVDIQDARRLARHSTIALTAEVYEDEAELEELGAATAKMSAPFTPRPTPQ